jgi:lipopolysaccharide export system protein LptA
MTPLKLIKTYPLLIAFFLLAAPAICTALPDDQNQPIYITADAAEVDEKTGLSIYLGNVNITQGSIVLKAQKITIHNNESGIKKLVAIDTPAHFQLLPEVGKKPIHAFGNTIEYFVSEERIKLIKQAKLEQEQSTFSGERIDYDIKHRIVKAYGGDQSNFDENTPRVNLILQPNKTSQVKSTKEVRLNE